MLRKFFQSVVLLGVQFIRSIPLCFFLFGFLPFIEFYFRRYIMARLSKIQRIELRYLIKLGWSIKEVCSKLNITYRTAKRWISRQDDDLEDQPRRVGVRKLSERSRRYIVKEITSSNKSLREISKSYEISPQTVRNYLTDSSEKHDPLYPYKVSRELPHNEEQLLKRQQFCEHFLNQNWREVCNVSKNQKIR